MEKIDNLLNKITMYRLVEYGLLILVGYSLLLSFFGFLPFKPFELIILLLTLTSTCFFGNLILAKIFRASVNAESSLITSFILYFLLWPSFELNNVLLFAFVGIVAMLSKYILAYKKKHIFNPAAIACVALIFFNSGALWWVATANMLPVTLILGLLVVRKIRRLQMFFTFIFVTTASFLVQAQINHLNIVDQTLQFFTSFPVIFFGTIMLTEPLTTPPTRRLQLIYAALLGFLFSWQGSTNPLILTTELVLVFGNLFSFIVSPKVRLKLKLKSKIEIATDTFEFNFEKPKSFKFHPGQYLEWTLPSIKSDLRGNRRFFTIASSPTEEFLKLGIKFNNPSSSFKKILSELKEGLPLTGAQLVGDFTLPTNKTKKLVFIAGGIGITPFRSMIKYMIDGGDKRDVVLFYSNKSEKEIAYKDVFTEAIQKIGIKVIYIISDEKEIPQNWLGEKGRIDEKMLKKYVNNISSSTFYLSGPVGMVNGYKKLLSTLKVNKNNIVTDYFPGF